MLLRRGRRGGSEAAGDALGRYRRARALRAVPVEETRAGGWAGCAQARGTPRRVWIGRRLRERAAEGVGVYIRPVQIAFARWGETGNTPLDHIEGDFRDGRLISDTIEVASEVVVAVAVVEEGKRVDTERIVFEGKREAWCGTEAMTGESDTRVSFVSVCRSVSLPAGHSRYGGMGGSIRRVWRLFGCVSPL